MTTTAQRLSLILLYILLPFFNLTHAGPGYTKSLELLIEDNHVVIKAEHVELKKILHAISQNSGMEVSYFVPPPLEPISCNINEPSISISLALLLRNWNYSLVFRESQDGPMVPDTLLLLGKNSHNIGITGNTAVKDQTVELIQRYPASNLKMLFPKHQIQAKKFKLPYQGDGSEITVGISTSLMQEPPGIQITSLDPDSSFAKIGLRRGDRITFINGTTVESVDDLILALQSTRQQSILKIERYPENQEIDPIYIEMH